MKKNYLKRPKEVFEGKKLQILKFLILKDPHLKAMKFESIRVQKASNIFVLKIKEKSI